MSHVIAETPHDTHLSPVLFAEGEDRRASARVPMGRPVRVGPVHGAPEALVSVRDISIGGMFVDAERQVRVGARFSVELDLPDSGAVYIAEAEVAYNRETDLGPGFGVRFMGLDSVTRDALSAEVERQTASFVGGPMPASVSTTDLPTLVPEVRRAAQADVPTDEIRLRSQEALTRPNRGPAAEPDDRTAEEGSKAEERDAPELEATASAPVSLPAPVFTATLPPEPDLASDIASPSDILIPEPADSIGREPSVWSLDALSSRWSETLARTAPGILLLAGLGTVIVVAVLALMDGASPSHAIAATSDPLVDGRTHDVLMGEAQPLGIESPAPTSRVETDGEKKNPLPPLVILDPPSSARPAPTAHVGATFDAKTPNARAAKPKEVRPAEVAGASDGEVKKAASSPAPMAPQQSKPATRRRTLSPAAQALLGKETLEGLSVDADATIRKQYVLSNPPRFVVDIAGQTSPLETSVEIRGVRRVRSGRHDGFVRLVFDLERSPKTARATLVGSRIRVILDID